MKRSDIDDMTWLERCVSLLVFGGMALLWILCPGCGSNRPPATGEENTEFDASTPAAIPTFVLPQPGAPHVGAPGEYPDPAKTPGSTLNVTAAQVCKYGYSRGVRAVSIDTKRQVYQAYGLSYPQPAGAYELDHFISLELGGSNDVRNLWPEPASPVPGFHEKDVVENVLHAAMCAGRITLQQAQEAIRGDWLAVYRQIAP